MDVPRFSPLQILGYFAVLESILTHAPNPDDRYDSITRQIKQKLALLNGRWRPPLDYSAFSGLSHDKVWSKMYAYRSAIAHGATPNFDGELSALGKAENSNVLISEAVRKTICQALEEPPTPCGPQELLISLARVTYSSSAPKVLAHRYFGFLMLLSTDGCPILCGFQRMGFCAVHSESDYSPPTTVGCTIKVN